MPIQRKFSLSSNWLGRQIYSKRIPDTMIEGNLIRYSGNDSIYLS